MSVSGYLQVTVMIYASVKDIEKLNGIISYNNNLDYYKNNVSHILKRDPISKKFPTLTIEFCMSYDWTHDYFGIVRIPCIKYEIVYSTIIIRKNAFTTLWPWMSIN